MTTRRSFLLTLGAGVFGAPIAGRAQPAPGKVRRIGFLGLTTAAGVAKYVEAFRSGLKEFGYIEGKNLVVEYRWADGVEERLPQLAAELLRAKVEVIVTYSGPGVRAAHRATTTVPIVIASMAGDPVSMGVAKSLARPGGNVTGMVSFNTLLNAKLVELVRDTLPHAQKVAFMTPSDGSTQGARDVEAAAKALKLDLQLAANVKGVNAFESAIAGMAKQRVDALIVAGVVWYTPHEDRIAATAARHRIPALGRVSLAESGALIGYGVSQLNTYRRAAYFVDRIFKGAKPGDLPIEQPTTFELVINMKTARLLGIKIPEMVLARADRVIN